MKKKLLIVSDNSVLAGSMTRGIAEVVDGLAVSLTDRYSVSVYCPKGADTITKLIPTIVRPKSPVPGVERIRMFGMDYWLDTDYPKNARAVTQAVGPEILHGFALPELLGELTARPGRCVYTLEDEDFAREHAEALGEYDKLLTVSNAHAARLREALGMEILGAPCGILGAGYSPSTGFLLAARYTAEDQRGKQTCKARLARTYGTGDKCVYLLMGRLSPDKGVDAVLEALPAIRERGGIVLAAGRGDADIEARLGAYGRGDGLIWVQRSPNPVQALGLLAGADFLLNPSVYETCGLTALKAAHMGTVPVTTLTGGLADSMDEEIAVIIREGLSEAVERASELYRDREALERMRRAGMTRPFTWEDRIGRYADMYDGQNV